MCLGGYSLISDTTKVEQIPINHLDFFIKKLDLFDK